MTTVKELREWLNQFDDDVIIEMSNGIDDNFHLKSKEDLECGGCEGVNFVDFRKNIFTKDESWWFGKQILQFGE